MIVHLLIEKVEDRMRIKELRRRKYVSSGQSLYNYQGLKHPVQPLRSNKRLELASNTAVSYTVY